MVLLSRSKFLKSQICNESTRSNDWRDHFREIDNREIDHHQFLFDDGAVDYHTITHTQRDIDDFREIDNREIDNRDIDNREIDDGARWL